MVPPSFVEYALRAGADGVLVAACREGDCEFRTGDALLQARLDAQRAPALRPTVPRERVRLVPAGRTDLVDAAAPRSPRSAPTSRGSGRRRPATPCRNARRNAMASLPAAHVPARRDPFRVPAPPTRSRSARDASARLATGWLVLGVAALVGSGIFSLLLVLARTPGLKDLFPVANFFQVALVAHVDLSVLVWFLAFAGVLWSLACDARAIALGWVALALCAAGTVALCVAPLAREAVPVLANYIPVIDNAIFLGGLAAIGAGVALAVARTFLAASAGGAALDGETALRWGILGSAVATAVALAAFGWSWMEISPHLERKAYFELLFWGGGHVLQFTWTLLMLAGWLWLASALGIALPLSPRVTLLVFTIALASVFVTPVIYLAHPVASVEHHKLQTWLMRFGGGLAIPPILLALLWGDAQAPGAGRRHRGRSSARWPPPSASSPRAASSASRSAGRT